ncbi:MAG: hypothetical protein WBA57_18755 [Elainellaceae cyanobacterium]
MKNPQDIAEKRTEAERMQDVELLLDHLSASQEVTIKLILDCLYDVGATNLINQKVAPKALNKISKSVAARSKPAFRTIGYLWFKKNCPQLITNWLHDQVAFGVPPTTLESLNTQTVEVPDESVRSASVVSIQDVKRLQAQVRLLTGVLIGSLTLIGGTAVWWFYGVPESQRLQNTENSPTANVCQFTESSDCL